MVETVTTSGTGHRFAIREPEGEIAFESLNANDEILIQTENSRYRLTVIDPVEHRATLSGGSLGDHPYEVVFIGALQAEPGFSASCSLKTGARALFFMESPRGLKRMITSVIVDLKSLNARGH